MKNCHHEPFFFYGSAFISIDDERPQSSSIDVSPPPPNCLSIHLPLFQKKEMGRECIAEQSNPGTRQFESAVIPGRAILLLSTRPSVIYTPSEYIDVKKRGEKPQAGPTGRPPARYHIDIRFRHLLLTRAAAVL